MHDIEKKIPASVPFEIQINMGVEAILAHPSITAAFQDLWNHDKNTAEHVMRVTLGMIRSAHVLYRDTLPVEEFRHVLELAALCGISHDLGKQNVDGAILRRTHVTKRQLEAIREPHMEHLREKIRTIQTSELSDEMKHEILAVIMSHHEFLANLNGRGPYPRKTVDGTASKTVRKTPSPMIRSLQAILAFSDTADRVTHGFHNTVTVDRDDARGMMKHILDEAMYPLSDFEINGIAPVVTDAVFEIGNDMVIYGMQKLGIFLK